MHTHFIDMKHAIEPKSSFHRREIKLSVQKITLTERFHVFGQKYVKIGPTLPHK